MNPLTVSEIKQKLEELEIPQSTLAKAINCNKDYLNRILCGRIEPTKAMLTKMRFYLEMKIK